jgi:RimJ/RimL family protein N-acetyltransferase
MIPVVLRTERLVLDEPTQRDIPLLTEYCQDPLFERYLTTPWPYREEHARGFVTDHVPRGWAEDTDFTWALRTREGGPLLGVIGHRTARSDVGFWLGAPHRGKGYMPEAVHTVLDWAFERGAARIAWECIAGNAPSAAVARKCGFRFTGAGPAGQPGRDGEYPLAWHAVMTAGDDRTEKPGWPA